MRHHGTCGVLIVCVCVCVLETEGARVQPRLYLGLLPGALKRHTAMHVAGSVYGWTLALSCDVQCVITKGRELLPLILSIWKTIFIIPFSCSNVTPLYT